MSAIFGNCYLEKKYIAGQTEVYPFPQGVSWNRGENTLFFGGANFKGDFPVVYKPNAASGRRFQLATSGRLHTKVQREAVASAAFTRQQTVFIFGGRNWKRPGQPSTDSFVQGDYRASFLPGTL